MAKEQYYAALDIGTQYVRVVQAKLDSATNVMSIVGAAAVPSFGMRKGVIVDIDEAVSSISQALERAERMTGVPITRAHVAASGNHISCMDSKGVIAVSRADGEIAEHDIVRVIDASQAISIPANREVLHVIPKSFTLDGQGGIKDPLGMTGIRLEVDTLIIHGGIPFLKNVHKAISQAGLEVDQLVVAPLASAQAVLSKRQKELGVAVVDMGAGTTSMVVYEENNVLHTTVIPIGSMHITNDIAIGLRCTVETAEKVKIQYGHALTREVDSYEQIDLSLIDPDESGTVSRLELVEIIEARLEEIFDQVHRELKAINRDGKLPAGIVFTGGGAHLPGLSDYAKEYIHLPTHIGMLQGVETIIDQVNDPAFATVVGTLLWGYTYGQPRSGSSWFSLGSFFDHETMVKLKKFWKSFLP